jgi:endonuclease G
LNRLKPVLAPFLGALALLATLLGPVFAETSCPAHYADGKPPELAQADLGAIELCSEAFAVAVTPATMNPVYAAEHLTPAGLAGAVQIPRVDAFHPDERVPYDFRAELRDYAASGFDRGHMAPAGDMPTPSAQHESFALSNMVPQNPNLNRGLWAKIEERVRREVVLRKEGFVVTGPAYSGAPKRLNGHVMIPTRIWKAVYMPGDAATNTPALAGAYIVDNAADAKAEIVSIGALARTIGFDPIPGAPAEAHSLANLPAVTEASR